MSNVSSNGPVIAPEPSVSKKAKKVISNLPHPVVAGALVIAVFLISQIVASGLVGMLAHLTGGTNGSDEITLFGSPILLQFAFILVAESMVLAFLAWYLRRRKVTWKSLGFGRPKWSDVGWAVLAFFVYIAAYIILLQAVEAFVPGFNADQKQATGFDGAAGLVPLSLVFVALVVLAPVTEETLLRGFFLGSLRRRFRFLAAALVTSAVFAALHLGGGEPGDGLLWVAAVDTFVLSLVLCYLREKTGRLWASILLHATKNFIAFLALFIFASGG